MFRTSVIIVSVCTLLVLFFITSQQKTKSNEQNSDSHNTAQFGNIKYPIDMSVARLLSKPFTSRNKSLSGDSKIYSHFTYLQFDGLKDLKFQKFINKKIEDSLLELETIYEGASIDGSTSVRFFNKRLMVYTSEGLIKKNNENQNLRLYQAYTFNLHSGKIYQLSDLFISNTDVEIKLFSILKSNSEKYRIKDTSRYVPLFTYDDFLLEWNLAINRTFTITEDKLQLQVVSQKSPLYLMGYEIPYTDFSPLINKNGELWKLLKAERSINMLVEDRDY